MTRDNASPTTLLCTALYERAREGPPDAVIEAARAVVLDAVGCLFAGSAEKPSRASREYVAAIAGRGQSSVVGLAQQVDAASAAFANGVTIHALDFEPIGSPPCHAPASVLPAVLALAESCGAGGRDLITAFVLGWEVECRLRTAGTLRSAFHPLAIYGPVAAAAASAVLLGLDPSGIESAVAIGASAAGGLAANGHTPIKVIHAGSAARAGVVAALQAQHGLSGASGVFERAGGYGDAFFAEVDWGTFDSIATGPEPEYYLTEDGVVYKPYPVQLPMLNVVDTVLDARSSAFELADLDALELIVAPLVASRSNPRPRSGHAGKFSTEYCAAAALVFGEVGIATFDDERLSDPRLMQVISRTTITERSDFELGDVTVRLRTVSGDIVEVSRTHARGSKAAPLTREQRIEKVRSCLGYGGVPEITGDLVVAVEELETAQDVSRLGALLRAPA